MVLLICENEFQNLGAMKWIFYTKSLCFNSYFLLVNMTDLLLFMQNFMKVPFKMSEIMVLNIHVSILTMILCYLLFRCFVALLPFSYKHRHTTYRSSLLGAEFEFFLCVSRDVRKLARGDYFVWHEVKRTGKNDLHQISKVNVTVKESDRITRPQAISIRETDGQILVACQNSDSLEIFNAS